MNLKKLAIEQAKAISNLSGNIGQADSPYDLSDNTENNPSGLNSMIGSKVIVRTYSAGVWFGELSEKSGNEVILTNARRMWRWWAKESISLSAVAIHGIKQDKSKIVAAVPKVWLEAIEIIPCTDKSIADLEEAKNVDAN